MRQSHSDSYKEAGVDITAGYEAVQRMWRHVQRTHIPGVLGGLGGFGGLFRPDLTGVAQPVLVSGTDGVGTKLKIAFLMDKHDTVGIDCVAMCVNDIICAGARPLFFLDYIACGKNDPGRIEAIVAGIAEGCVQAGCALVGGETAEMPGFYPEEEYDLAGFSVGMVDQDAMLSPQNVQPGDVLLGLPSSGLHSNGFSLVRKVFGLLGDDLTAQKTVLNAYVPELGETLGEALLRPTKIYVQAALALLGQGLVHGISHITGGGFFENIPRMLPPGLRARVDTAAIPAQPLFALLARRGGFTAEEMYNTFNMGVGLCVAVPAQRANEALQILRETEPGAFVLGAVETGEGGVAL